MPRCVAGNHTPRVQGGKLRADMSGMDLPGGRPTPGLEEAIRLLAQGADSSRVLREILRVAVTQTGGVRALVLARQGEHVADLAVHGTADACLRAATAEALARGAPARRSNPIEGANAGAVPVVGGGRVVGALGVAGPADRLDARALDTAAALVAVCLSREGVVSVSSAPFEALAPLAEATDRGEVAAAALTVLARFTSGPALVCFDQQGRLRVERYRAVAREDVSGIVGSPAFLDLVAKWRDRPLPPPGPEAVVVEGHGVLACAPLVHGDGVGLLALVASHEDVPASLRLLGALAPHVGAALDRARAGVDVARRDREVDGVVQATPLPVVVLDAAGSFLRMNAPACELLGLSGSFDSGRPARGRLGAAALEALVLDGELPGEVEVELGSPARTFRATVTRVHDGAERLRTVVVLEDQSARREQEQARADFASVLGHELRTPLTVAKGFLETVLGHPDQVDGERRDHFLRRALAQTERLEDLINDLLYISTERPRDPSLFEACDVLAVAQEVVGRFAAAAPDREIECMALVGDARAFLDRRHLAHALRHLVDNALKYSDGAVRVEVSGDDRGLEVGVVDQGPGIFSGDLERLFRPFEQLDSSSTRDHGGAGLGLYLARRLVEGLGGRLDCDSRLGQGSRFTFRLPRRPAAARVPEVRDDARS